MQKIAAVLLMMASMSVFAGPDKLNFCSGGEGGAYYDLGVDIGNKIVSRSNKDGANPIKNNVLITGGSVDNADRLKEGECDIGILQADVVTTQPLPANIKVIDAHRETAFWLFGKKGIEDFGRMEDDEVAKKYAVAAVAGSGALVTIKNWVETDKDYAGVRIVEFEDWYQAAEATAQGHYQVAGVKVQIAGMLYIGRPGKITTDITEDFGNQLMVGEVNDGSFASFKDFNGQPLYTSCTVGAKDSNGIKLDTIGSADTYCLNAQVVYNMAWHNGDSRLRKDVDKGINGIVKSIR